MGTENLKVLAFTRTEVYIIWIVSAGEQIV